MYQFKKYIVCTALVILGAMICGTINGQNLKRNRWENRVLLIQASDISSEKFQDQLSEFNDSQEGLEERKLLVYQIVGDKYRIYNSPKKKSDEGWKGVEGRSFSSLDKGEIFKVTLIGLDGGIKLERTTILKKIALFRIIDSMPMRISEMRNNKN
ncbi:MAG: hypothetical protein ACJA01_004514 [Saprospiraceae bacterium]|jgi:hypothetical protein